MIHIINLSKAYNYSGVRKIVADNITVKFPSNKSIALLGRNGVGKSSLLKMIAGTMDCDAGQIISDGSISWPVGFAGSFHPDLTGVQNTRFIARVYGVNSKELIDFVDDFSELGKYFYLPFRLYSSGMKSRLAFAMSMGIKFDTYLVDEVTSVGDDSFRKKSSEVFQDRMKDSGAIVVSHSIPMIQKLCNAGAVLENGKLRYFKNLDDAIQRHKRNIRHGKPAN